MFINFELTGVNFRGINVQPVPPTPTYYTITINQVSGGTITCNKTTEIEAGETIIITATPSSGYTLSSITVNGVEIEENTFVMPAENVTVSAVFEQEQPVGLDYLTFTSNGLGATVKYNATTYTTAEYSTDGGNTWQDAVGVTVTLENAGDSVKYRGVISGKQDWRGSAYFEMTGRIGASGSIMSMCNNNPDDTVITYDGSFKGLFKGCTSLTSAPELPATTLTSNCYEDLFNGCMNLTSAPELPATTLERSCYSKMFRGCITLNTAPELPATTLADYCYSSMFRDCTFLTTAPELPATELANACYIYIFKDCTFLTSVTHHIIDWDLGNCVDWMMGTGLTGTVYCPAASTIPSNSASGIPRSWNRADI